MPTKSDIVIVWSALAPIVSWLLVINGWRVINRDNNLREKRHEMRSALDAFIADIVQLEKWAYEYYTKSHPATPALLGVTIKTVKTTLDSRLKRLVRMSASFSEGKDALRVFGDNLTGGKFEQIDRVEVPESDGKLLEISLSARNLVDCLEEAYSKDWHSK